MSENQKIPFNFTYFAMKLLGKNLYSNPWTAVSEIVANGIDAGANNVYVLIDMRNKEKAVVEIFDDGSGMSFEDLSEKYTLIGRNKRLGADNREGKTLGRKGIGKLAALYLSPCYYLYTKTDEGESAWCVNTQIIKDSDIPALIGTTYDTEMLMSKNKWNELKTGTMIHLSDVDLRKIGREKLKSLPIMLADYYLDHVISSTVSVCVIEENNDRIVFSPIEKKVNFDTMFGIFDNTGLGYKDRIQSKVYITKDTVYKEVDFPRDTVILNEEKYVTSGKISLTNLNGQVVQVPYNMVGWIGIHSSLDNAVLQRNSPHAKKNQLHPNALRLYVRGKLAVSNLMPYIRSVAAFAPYIEGEISFDILDDDLFEDASTSNREGYSISDPRIQKLSEIVGKIINTLVIRRNDAGKKVNEEIKAIKDRLEAEAEEERKKRAEAEELAKQEKKEKERAQAEVKVVKKQAYFLQSQLTDDSKIRAYNTHVIKNNAGRINDNVLMLLTEHPECKDYKEVKNIALAGSKISTAVKYYNSANYDLVNKKINGNITEFISQYIDSVIKQEFYFMDICVDDPIDCVINFPPQDFTVLIENVFSNAEKAGAKKLHVSYAKNGKEITVKFSNDGAKLPTGVDKYQLFEFGYSHSVHRMGAIGMGTGIGLYQIHQLVNNSMQGSLDIYDNDDTGITLEVILYEI